MRMVPLGEIAEIVSGATPKTGVTEYWDGDIPWVTPADLSRLPGHCIEAPARYITKAGYDSCATTLLPAGSVLLSSRAPIGHVAINTIPVATNQGFKSLVPGPDVAAKYMFHWLRSNTAYLQSMGNGATFKELSKQTTSAIQIPLPPFDEQRRIAAILDQADALRTKRRAQLAKLDALPQAIFRKMFGNPLARGAQTVPIGSLAEVKTGNSPSRSQPENFGAHLDWVKSDNLGGTFIAPANERLSETGARRARLAPRDSVLVTCIAGSRSSIGKCSLAVRTVAFNQQINAILPSEKINPVFLLWQLKTNPELIRQASTGGMKGLVSKSRFSAIEILNPPQHRQQEFASRAAAVQRVSESAASQLMRDEALFASLQAQAFRGGL